MQYYCVYEINYSIREIEIKWQNISDDRNDNNNNNNNTHTPASSLIILNLCFFSAVLLFVHSIVRDSLSISNNGGELLSSSPLSLFSTSDTGTTIPKKMISEI